MAISAVLNVAQAVSSPWPLQLVDHQAHVVIVTLHPGSLVAYEGHSVIHGYPYPLEGSYSTNLVFHFAVAGYSREYELRMKDMAEKVDAFEEAFVRVGQQPQAAKAEVEFDLPPYIQEGSEEAKRWKQDFVFVKLKEPPRTENGRIINVHHEAAVGNLRALKRAAVHDVEILVKKDVNGWQPIHEAARSGETEVLEYLIDNGADVNARTNDGKGGTPLYWAKRLLDVKHPSIDLLEKHGGKYIKPGSKRTRTVEKVVRKPDEKEAAKEGNLLASEQNEASLEISSDFTQAKAVKDTQSSEQRQESGEKKGAKVNKQPEETTVDGGNAESTSEEKDAQSTS